jgi:hypothetical protein
MISGICIGIRAQPMTEAVDPTPFFFETLTAYVAFPGHTPNSKATDAGRAHR